ncbi:hypothetical protein Tco_0968682 [Tanacetum coccineum]
MLEVIAALAQRKKHSESTHFRAESSLRDAQGTPTQSADQASISQSTADFQGTAEAQGTAAIPQSPNDYTPTDEAQTSGGDKGLWILYALNREVRRLKKQTISQAKQIHKLKAKLKKLSKGVQPQSCRTSTLICNLSEEHHDQDDHHHTTFVYEDVDAKEAVVTPDLERKNDETEEGVIEEKRCFVALETANDEEVARKVQAEWDAEEERKRLEALKKPKTISKKPTSLAQERTQMMNFLKGQGYKNLQKLRYPQMKELYDKVQESIKDSFKDFIPMGSEKEKQMLQERDAKRLLRKRKATVTEDQPSKKLKLRTDSLSCALLKKISSIKRADDQDARSLKTCMDAKERCLYHQENFESSKEILVRGRIVGILKSKGQSTAKSKVITEYLVNISKRRAFWSLNEDILKITILKTNTPYPSRKIRHIRACTHQRPQRKEDQYAVIRMLYADALIVTELMCLADDYLLGEVEVMAYEQMVVPAVDEIAEQMVVPAIEEVAELVAEAEEEQVITPVVDIAEGQMDAQMMDTEEDLVALLAMTISRMMPPMGLARRRSRRKMRIG